MKKLLIVLAIVLIPFLAIAQSTEIIIDNGELGTSYTGTWKTSGGQNPYGTDSLYSDEANATYTFEASTTGTYEVSLWWTYYSTRCTNIPIEIYDGVTLFDTVYVNQRENGSQWNVLGTYNFNGTAKIVVNSVGSCNTCADAVKFVSSSQPTNLTAKWQQTLPDPNDLEGWGLWYSADQINWTQIAVIPFEQELPEYSYQFDSPKTEGTLYFRMNAYDEVPNFSDWSDIASINLDEVDIEAPAIPDYLTIEKAQ